MLIGLGKMIKKVTSNLNLLVSRVIGYTSVIGSGGSSYYTTTTGSVSPLYMALGYTTGPIAASTDGINWTQTINLGDWENASPVYGNGIWAASNPNGKVYTTTDGYNWSMNRPLDEGYLPAGLTNVKFLNNKFVMFKAENSGGENYKSYVSTNARDWTITDFTGPSRTKLWADSATVIYGNGLYVTRFANQYVTDTYVEHFAYSTDAINWNFSSLTLDTTSSTASGNDNQFVYFDDKFILISRKDGKVYHSTDLQNWNTVAGVGSEYYWFNNNDQKMLVVTANGNVKYSLDGISWNTGIDVSNILGFEAQRIISVNNQFVITPNDSNSTSVIVSSDAINWNLVENLPISYIQNISYANNYYLIGGGSEPHAFNYSTSLTSSSIWTQSTVQGVYGEHGAQFNFGSYGVVAGSSNTLVEVQVSIGNQGEEGSEILAPIDVYTVPVLKTTDIQQVTVKNNSANTITYDLAVLNSGIELTDQNALINDQAVLAGATATVTSISNDMTAGQRIVVLPSAVDVVEVKVYGTETQLTPYSFSLPTFDGNARASAFNGPNNNMQIVVDFTGPVKDDLIASLNSPANNAWANKQLDMSNLTTSVGDTSYLNNNIFTIESSEFISGGIGTVRVVLTDSTDIGMVISFQTGTFEVYGL